MLNSRLNLADLLSIEQSRDNLGLSNVSLYGSNAVDFRVAANTLLHPTSFAMTGMVPGELLAFDKTQTRIPMPSWANERMERIDVGAFANSSAHFVRSDELAPIARSGDIHDVLTISQTDVAADRPEWWKISYVIQKLERPNMTVDAIAAAAAECRSNLGVDPLQTYDRLPPMPSLATRRVHLGDPPEYASMLTIRPDGSGLELVPLRELLTSTNGFVRLDGEYVPFFHETKSLLDEASERINTKLTHYEETARSYEHMLRSNAHRYVTKAGHLNDVDDLHALRDRLGIGTLATLSRPVDEIVWNSGALRTNTLAAPWLAVKQHGGLRPDSDRFEDSLLTLVNGTLSNLPNAFHPEASSDASNMGRVRVRYNIAEADYPVESPPSADLADAPSYPAFFSRGTNVVIRAQNIYKSVLRNPLNLSSEFNDIVANGDMSDVLLRQRNLQDLVETPEYDQALIDKTLELHPLAYHARYDAITARPTKLSDFTNDAGFESSRNAFVGLSALMRAQLLALFNIRSLANRNARDDAAYVAGDTFRTKFTRVRETLRIVRSDGAGDMVTDHVGCMRGTGRFERIPRAEDESTIFGTTQLGRSFESTKGVATTLMVRRMQQEVDARCKVISRAIKAAYQMRGLDPYRVIPRYRHHHLEE